MATFYVQKIYDIGLPGYVQYITAIPTTTPNPASTTPVGVGPFNAATHLIQSSFDNPNQDILGGINVDTPMAPSAGQVPTWDGTEFVPGSGGGVNVIWEWNGLDTTQFSNDNTLPAPGLAGAVVGGSLTATTDITNPPSSKVLTVALTSVVNSSAVWWINDLVPLQNMRIEMICGYPNPGPVALSGDEVVIGFVYAGDTDGHYITDDLSIKDDGLGAVIFKRSVYQVRPGGIVVLQDDTLNFGSYVFSLTTDLIADRLDTTFGAPGVPRGTGVTQTAGWLPSPTTGGLGGSAFILNSAYAPPGAGWPTSACNRIGISYGGAMATPASSNILSLRIVGI